MVPVVPWRLKTTIARQIDHGHVDGPGSPQPLDDLRQDPTRGSFQVAQNFVEPFPEIRDDVIAIEADPMPGMERRGRPPYQHRVRHQRLEMPLGGQQIFPVSMCLSAHAHKDSAGTAGTAPVVALQD